MLSMAPSPPPSAVAKPRTALAYLGKAIDTKADQAAVARHQFAVLGLWPGLGAKRLQATVSGIKALNPSIQIAQYVMLQERRDDAPPTDPPGALETNGWWLLDAAGKRTQWTAAYGAWNTNPTEWTHPDTNGDRWPQFKAKFDSAAGKGILSLMKGIDFINIDGFGNPTVNADWRRIGTNQSMNDPEIMSAFRRGHMAYVAKLRELNPGLHVMGNAPTAAITSPEYKGQLQGFFRECLIGKNWSMETWSSWDAMMASYRTALAATLPPNVVVFGSCHPTADPAMYRYGLASTMLEDGYFSFAINNTYDKIVWFDEGDAPIGTPAEPPPKSATPSGVWMRKYTHGLVLVNPNKTATASIDIGPGYKRLAGTVDPTFNDGREITTPVSMPPRSGVLLLKK